jgi:hypothetical protein
MLVVRALQGAQGGGHMDWRMQAPPICSKPLKLQPKKRTCKVTPLDTLRHPRAIFLRSWITSHSTTLDGMTA